MPTAMKSGLDSLVVLVQRMIWLKLLMRMETSTWLGTQTVPYQVRQVQVGMMPLCESTMLTAMNYGQHSSELQAMT